VAAVEQALSERLGRSGAPYRITPPETEEPEIWAARVAEYRAPVAWRLLGDAPRAGAAIRERLAMPGEPSAGFWRETLDWAGRTGDAELAGRATRELGSASPAPGAPDEGAGHEIQIPVATSPEG
jgi:hypothetical protein